MSIYFNTFFRQVLVETCGDYLFEHPVIYIRIGQEISVRVGLDNSSLKLSIAESQHFLV